MRQSLRNISPDLLLLLLLAAWWLLNVVLGASIGLADDEAYYWSWVCYGDGALDWGYYDHPPMVAWLIWLTSWMGGTLGVRFATLLLQPLYLWLFWRLLRPDDASHREALLYAGLCFAMPALQLYGLLALPDAPLMCFSVLFLYAYRRFLQRQTTGNALLMGLSMALLAYSKYHGALVVAFALLSNPRLLKSWRLYLSAAVALLLFLPHLCWQWQHDWCSFSYHLGERHKGFDIENPLMVIVNLLVFFNPLFVWHYGKAFFAGCSDNSEDGIRREWLRTMRWIVAGFVLFFFVAAFRGSTQIQWLLPVGLGLLALLMDYAHRNPRCHRYLLTTAAVVAVLFVAVRLLVLLNPAGWKGEVWHNRETYSQIAELADGRPVLFEGYARTAKYAYYTGNECACTPTYYQRKSQWTLRQDDRGFYGREVLKETSGDTLAREVRLPNGKGFEYRIAPYYRPVRGVVLWLEDVEEPLLVADTLLPVRLYAYNPYSYDIQSGEADSLHLCIAYRLFQRSQPTRIDTAAFCLHAGDTTVVDCLFPVHPAILENPGDYAVCFMLAASEGVPTIHSRYYAITSVLRHNP